MREGKARIQFNGSLVKFESSRSITREIEFEPLSGYLQSLKRSAERLFERLIESRHRIRGLPQLGAEPGG